MFNFWTFLFRGRLRRLERAQQAAALLAQGKLEEAEDRLEMAKSPGFGQDVAIYHFVKARLHMVRGEWRQAEVHLLTAVGLGLTRPSVDMSLGLVKARLRQPIEAMEAFDRIGVEGNDEVLAQAAAVKEQVRAILSGAFLAQLESDVESAARGLGLDLGADPIHGIELIAGAIREGRLDRDGASLLLGAMAVRHQAGAWLLGLEPSDHAVVTRGRLFIPAQEVDRFLGGSESLGPDWLWKQR